MVMLISDVVQDKEVTKDKMSLVQEADFLHAIKMKNTNWE